MLVSVCRPLSVGNDGWLRVCVCAWVGLRQCCIFSIIIEMIKRCEKRKGHLDGTHKRNHCTSKGLDTSVFLLLGLEQTQSLLGLHARIITVCCCSFCSFVSVLPSFRKLPFVNQEAQSGSVRKRQEASLLPSERHSFFC